MTRLKKYEKALHRLIQRCLGRDDKTGWLSQTAWNALATLAKRYFRRREHLDSTGEYESLSCICKIDRFALTVAKLSVRVLAAIPGFRLGKRHRLWKRDYTWAQRIEGTGSIDHILIESGPTAPWFSKYRVTIIPRDATGLQHRDLQAILEILPNFTIVLLEIAWDFPAECLIDLAFVKRFCLFGKTWIRASQSGNPFHERWGSTRSKIVRAYVKWEIYRFRIELELRTPFLKKHAIDDIFDFVKLVDVLVPDHIGFFRFDEQKVSRALRRSGLPRKKRVDILQRAKRKARRRLWYALRSLRREAQLPNVRRLLVSLDEPNRVVRQALETLIAQWPSAPARLGVPK